MTDTKIAQAVADEMLETVEAAKQDIAQAPVAAKTLPRRKAINITLSNGYALQMHAVGFEDMPVYFRAMGALDELYKLMRGAIVPGLDGKDTVNLFALPPIPPEVTEPILPLLAVMCDLSIDDFKLLPIEDSMTIMFSIDALTPKNSIADQES